MILNRFEHFAAIQCAGSLRFPLEALGIPHALMSASDPEKKCMAFVEANDAKCMMPTHWYKGMKEQVAGGPCARHPRSLACIPAPQQVDLAMCGTPCHAFSTQRATRYKRTTVESHHEYNIAMDQWFTWMERFSPTTAIFEQVVGFEMPLEQGSQETPLDQPLVRTVDASLLGLKFPQLFVSCLSK